MANRKSIGVFDSGIGGLTVAKAIMKLLPNETVQYFGDTAHVPYGDKSGDSVRHYAQGITEFLLSQNAKMIVIACNTGTSHAYNTVQEICGPAIPVVNVVDPVAAYVSGKFAEGKIGVIGTKGTIDSRIYVKRIKSLNRKLKVVTKATPLLAPMIEEGFYNNTISQTIINSYLQIPAFDGVDAMVLGCTHYPLIKNEVKKALPPQVEVIDSASVVAKHIQQEFDYRQMHTKGTKPPAHHFYVSDYTESFEKSTRLFFKQKLRLEEARIWEI